MLSYHKQIAFTVFSGLAFFVTGCSSNNSGKIIGKWKITSPPEGMQKQEAEAMAKEGIYIYIDFRADNVLVMGLGADQAEKLALLKSAIPGGKITWEAKYKLGMGNSVEVYDVKDEEIKKAFKGDKARADVTITGDDMTMKDPDGTITKLARVKDMPAATPANPPKK